MSAALHDPITLAGFLAWEERQELRYEFDGFQPLAMTCGTVAHDQITFNLRKARDASLTGKPCRPHGPNLQVLVDGRARYPDAVVACRPLAPDATVIGDPVVVFEVLCDGTSKTDLIDKNREYRATPSILLYVIPHQTHRAAISFVRRGEGWLSEIVVGGKARLRLPEIEAVVCLDELYAGVDLPDDAGA